MSAYSRGPRMNSAESQNIFNLSIVQQPKEGRTLPKNQRAKGHTWPVDPPPVLELVISAEPSSESWIHMHNPNWFCVAELIPLGPSDSPPRFKKIDGKGPENAMHASWSSSLHKVKGGVDKQDKTEHGYFVFGDINIKVTGLYQLRFTLFEMRRHDEHVYATKIAFAESGKFRVRSQKGEVNASTPFSRLLAEAGVKVKLRAEPTKRKSSKPDWSSKQADSVSRQPQLAPLQAAFLPSITQNEFRGRSGLGIEVRHRIEATHDPLSAMIGSSTTSASENMGHVMGAQLPQFPLTMQSHNQQSWQTPMAPPMHRPQTQVTNAYASVNEPSQYPATMALPHERLPMSMPPPRLAVPNESNYDYVHSTWYSTQQQQPQQTQQTQQPQQYQYQHQYQRQPQSEWYQQSYQ